MQEQKIIEFYKTKDQFTAILLYSLGQKIDGGSWVNNTYWFSFEDKERCEDLITKHLNNELTVGTKVIQDSMNTIKSIIYSN